MAGGSGPLPLFMDTLLKIDPISAKYCAISFFTAAIKSAKVTIPSVDKGRHGFDGQKYAHTASSPLEIRQVFPTGLSLSGHISARQNCFAPACDGFPSDFWLLSRRRAGRRVCPCQPMVTILITLQRDDGLPVRCCGVPMQRAAGRCKADRKRHPNYRPEQRSEAL